MSWWSWIARGARARTPIERIDRVLRSRRTFGMDCECVANTEDYVAVIRGLAGTTGGILVPDRIECIEGDTRQITIIQGQRRWVGPVAGNTDWVDEEPLRALLNAALSDLGAPGRIHFVDHRDPGRRSQEGYAVYARDDELQAIRDAGFVLADDPRPEPPDDEELTEAREVHGIAFRAGTFVEYWRDPPFDEMQVTLGDAQPVAGLELPAGTEILFLEEGTILCCVIPVAYSIAGRVFAPRTRIPFEGGDWRLDQACVETD